jgi:outer membrane autotransporter protein
MMTPMGLYARALRLSMTLALTLACAALALFWPGWLTSLRAQTYGYPVSISIVSGQGGSGATGQQLPPFVVQTSPPTSGVTVVWSVNAGGGTLASAATVTAANGRASNVLTVGSTAGITVNATVTSGNTVTFTATCTNCGAQPITGADAALDGLRQASTLIPVGLISARTQLHNIGLRLQSLRRGGSTLSTGGLSMTIDGEPAPAGVAASHLFSLPRGTGASADASPLGNLGVFANGLGTFGDQRSSRNEPGFDFHTAGVTAGADYRVLPQLVLGLALGFGSTRNDFGGAGDVTSKGFSVSGYGGYTLGGFHADAIFTYGWIDYDTERRIASAAGPVTAKGSPGGDQLAVGANVGYDFSFGALTIGPSLRLTYVDVTVDGFNERGGGAFNMRLRRQNTESLTTSLGGEVSYAISVPFGVLTPLLRFEWEHEYLAGSRLVTGTLATDPTGTVFGIRTNAPDRDYFNLGVGLTGTFRSGVAGFFYYEALLGRDRVTNHSFTAGVRLEF